MVSSFSRPPGMLYVKITCLSWGMHFTSGSTRADNTIYQTSYGRDILPKNNYTHAFDKFCLPIPPCNYIRSHNVCRYNSHRSGMATMRNHFHLQNAFSSVPYTKSTRLSRKGIWFQRLCLSMRISVIANKEYFSPSWISNWSPKPCWLCSEMSTIQRIFRSSAAGMFGYNMVVFGPLGVKPSK